MTDFEREALLLLMEYLERVESTADMVYKKHFQDRVEKAIRDRVFRVIPREER